MAETPTKKIPEFLSFQINLGQVLISAAIGLYAIGSWTGQVTSSQGDVRQLQTSLDKTDAKLTKQIAEVQAAIANLPADRVTVQQLGLRVDEANNRAVAQSNRLDLIQQQSIQSAADVTNIGKTLDRLSNVVQQIQAGHVK